LITSKTPFVNVSKTDVQTYIYTLHQQTENIHGVGPCRDGN